MKPLRKTLTVIAALCCLCLYAMGMTDAPSPHHTQGGCITWTGKIGPYDVAFTFCDLDMPGDPTFTYQYTKIQTNNGKPIELRWKKNQGRYLVYNEYINGRHTGTFTIIRTKERIDGTFRNAKGKTYRVKAVQTESNWVDNGLKNYF